MAFHPNQITQEYIYQAINRINKENIRLIPSTKYEVIINGQSYPPKELMRYARYELDGSYDYPFSGGEPTNSHFTSLGFKITKKHSNENLISNLINNYKVFINQKGLDPELYKWELVKRNLGHPDLKAKDFKAEMSRLDLSNLVYPLVTSTINDFAQRNPAHYRDCLAILYDENRLINDRIEHFDIELKRLNRSILEEKKHTHHHDERTVSVLLTYFNPTKYTFYKESYYIKYCKYLGIENIKTKGGKYSHYLELIYQLANYISKDNDLVRLVNSLMNKNCYLDSEHLILAQDILYQSFDSTNFNLDKTNSSTKMNRSRIPLNQILYGPPGTGKTYNTINRAIEIINPSFDLNQDRHIIKSEFNRLTEEGLIRFVTFHQSFSYEDFVEGIKPKTIKKTAKDGDKTHDIVYEIEAGVFKQLCKNAIICKDSIDLSSLVGKKLGKTIVIETTEEIIRLRKPQGGEMLLPITMLLELKRYLKDNNIDLLSSRKIDSSGIDRSRYPTLEPYLINGYPNFIPELMNEINSIHTIESIKDKQNHVLIIDEINRGNIASIFGELITLIEEDKRERGTEMLSTVLPYSKEKFSVPKNIYIIGTMNTADRSVEALDIALRRRFSFIEMAPNYSLIENKEFEGVNLCDLLNMINLRIEKLLDKDHRIGHAYFMRVNTKEDLKKVFKDKIIPLLEEYFFGDYSKIGLILGKSFIQRNEYDSTFKFADFESDDLVDLLDKPIYKLTDSKEWNFDSIL